PLSDELIKSHGVDSLPVRTGDSVRILRGDRKGLEGKVIGVDRKNYRIFVEGVTREKVDGTAIQIPIHPSKVIITSLNLDDKWRREIIKRKSALKEAVEKPEAIEKPEEVVVKEEVKVEAPIKKEEKAEKRKRKPRKKVEKRVEEKEEEKPKKTTRGKARKAKTEKGGE
ncbi:MAG: 50S ribosomal protein L24, partial [Candidatus Bathyarchaeia archaeon]